jgi:hypothetical protein
MGHKQIPEEKRIAANDKIKYCSKHQVLGGLSICTELQLSCRRAVAAGKCPLGFHSKEC